jgi:hypothetical protein
MFELIIDFDNLILMAPFIHFVIFKYHSLLRNMGLVHSPISLQGLKSEIGSLTSVLT